MEMEKPLTLTRGVIPLAARPAFVTLGAMLVMVFLVIFNARGNLLELARLGTQYSQNDPNGTEGYDGQFVYYIARDPDPQLVRSFLDVPAYRYQRILLPLTAHILSLGHVEAIPWLLPVIVLLSQFVGTWIVGELLFRWGISPWYALTYGLWVGFTLAIRLDLPEPIAYALVAGGILAQERSKHLLSYTLFGLSIFAKEVAILFVAAAVLSLLLQKNWRQLAGLFLISILPYALFQLWMLKVFGQPGIGSGGAMATSFELIPFMGLWRIWSFSQIYALAMFIVFIPALVFPSMWGILASLRKLMDRDSSMVVFALLLNAMAIAFLPFSTFRETGGLLRFACGLVLAVLLFSARYKLARVLRYSQLWIILNVFLIKS
jgi:hypothetical protein